MLLRQVDKVKKQKAQASRALPLCVCIPLLGLAAALSLSAVCLQSEACAAIMPVTQGEQDAARLERLKAQQQQGSSQFSKIPGSSNSSVQSGNQNNSQGTQVPALTKRQGEAELNPTALSPGAYFASKDNLRKACVLNAALKNSKETVKAVSILGLRQGVAAVQILGTPRYLKVSFNGRSLAGSYLGHSEISCDNYKAGEIRFYSLKALSDSAGVLAVQADGKSAQQSLSLR